MIKHVFCLLFFLTAAYSYSQKVVDQDSILSDTIYHSPSKAALFSAVIPGTGQVYNKKYWKVPIIYGLLSYTVSSAINNANVSEDYKASFIESINNKTITNLAHQDLSAETLKNRVLKYRKNRDYMMVFSILVYVLNIVDASVDAHMFEFNVSDDLSLNVAPTLQQDFNTNILCGGLQLRLKL